MYTYNSPCDLPAVSGNFGNISQNLDVLASVNLERANVIFKSYFWLHFGRSTYDATIYPSQRMSNQDKDATYPGSNFGRPGMPLSSLRVAALKLMTSGLFPKV